MHQDEATIETLRCCGAAKAAARCLFCVGGGLAYAMGRKLQATLAPAGGADPSALPSRLARAPGVTIREAR
jgi:hypothetical protein